MKYQAGGRDDTTVAYTIHIPTRIHRGTGASIGHMRKGAQRRVRIPDTYMILYEAGAWGGWGVHSFTSAEQSAYGMVRIRYIKRANAEFASRRGLCYPARHPSALHPAYGMGDLPCAILVRCLYLTTPVNLGVQGSRSYTPSRIVI